MTTATTMQRHRRRRPQPPRSLVLMAALAALAFAALAARGVRAEAAGFKDPAELIVPGGSPTATQEKLDAVQKSLGQVQGDLEKKTGG